MGRRTTNASRFSERIVVLVEDDLGLRESLQGLLESASLRVLAFSNAQEVLATLGQQPVGCLITDVRMARMDGWQLQQSVAALHPHLPVIVITAYRGSKALIDKAETEAFAFLEKPLDGESLIETVMLALEQGANSLSPNS